MTEEVEKKIDGLEVTNEDEEDDVNPWDVRAKDEKGIDYDKLISRLHKISNFESPSPFTQNFQSGSGAPRSSRLCSTELRRQPGSPFTIFLDEGCSSHTGICIPSSTT